MNIGSVGEVKFLRDVRMETKSARIVDELLLKDFEQGQKMAEVFEETSSEDTLSLSKKVTKWSVGQLRPTTEKDFKYIRDLAIKQLEIDILHKMELLYRSFVCKNTRHLKEPLPFKVFSWSAREFEQRNKVNSNAGIDVLMKKVSNVCLEVRKLQVDIEECVRIITTLFASVQAGKLMENEMLKDIQKLLTIENTVEDELAENKAKLQQLISDWLLNRTAKNKEKANKEYQTEIEKQLMEAHVLDPIKIRYEINYYQMNATQAELKAERELKKYTDKIEEVRRAMRRESYTSQCSLNSYYSDTEKYKTRLLEMTNKYNKTYDEYENRNQYMRTTMETIRNQRKFLTEQIERFHEEIDRVLKPKALEEPVIQSAPAPKKKKGQKRKKKS
ncbi:PREDICTED: uncharacterized protein LOC108369898 [Rhagoletis zephyria]|uniref:uncharacterized protein LOC108369898 n=1 Tax=Rhagoletis zephyria TaxID=28612 RepID=UPI000811460C|nr:PREDICTED: uncharacterized protein LOC108369898 [Rhagoletis zephyria]